MQLAIVIGTVIGLLTSALIEDLALHRPQFQDVYTQWVIPMLITNVLFALAIVPFLMILFKRMAITVETRTTLMISFLLVVSIVVVTVVLILHSNSTLSALVPTVDLKAATYDFVRWAGMASIFILLAGTMTSLFLAKRLTSPVSLLGTAARTIGSGDFQTKVIDRVARRTDELGELARILQNMVESLKRHIEELKKTTAAKERIESELRVAAEIQMSMLPRIFPPFPDRKEFDIFASIEPAKEVGGDLYDFFFASPEKLCFIIGDVCDKGVPAALFMAITKALLRTAGMAGLPPDAMLTQTNNILNPENDASMFVTVFCAVLDATTGELKYANAGHPPPLINSNVDGFQYMKLPKGFVVGPMPGVVYTCQSVTLKPGEVIFLYTDGVTEAANAGSKFYSEARLQEALTKLKDKDATGMVGGVREDISAFVASSPQNDDITMLAIRFLGK
jgi:sigma-B regulation protein RsbU (phosphoserine phosphatase)